MLNNLYGWQLPQTDCDLYKWMGNTSDMVMIMKKCAYLFFCSAARLPTGFSLYMYILWDRLLFVCTYWGVRSWIISGNQQHGHIYRLFILQLNAIQIWYSAHLLNCRTQFLIIIIFILFAVTRNATKWMCKYFSVIVLRLIQCRPYLWL